MRKREEISILRLKESEQEICAFYNANRTPFINFLLKKFDRLRTEDAEDLYQEAFLALHINIRTGKLVELTGSLSTYLLQIGIHKALDKFKLKESQTTDYLNEKPESISHMELSEDDLTEHEKEVYQTINNLTSPCKEILFGFYYDKYSMCALADRLGYKDESVVKAMKYKCMQKVRNLLKYLFKKR